MKLVVDASVAVKWFFPEPTIEPGADRAVKLLRAVQDKRIELLQPPHWLLEVTAVITRLRPQIALQAIDLLDALELSIANDLAVLKLASRLATELEHHLFDTLYHAVALERDATLVSADQRYVAKASRLGSVVSLVEWRMPPEPGEDEAPAE